MDQSASHPSATRREILSLGAKAGALVALGGVIPTLGGCQSGSKRNKQSMIGQPVPADPVLQTADPLPFAPSASRPTISTSKLTVLPGFAIARNSWTNAKTKTRLADPMQRITKITVHHDAISPVPSGGYSDSIRRLNLIRKGHLRNQWADIGYHYAVDPAGRVWQARPLIYQGAHVKDHNPGNIGIVVFGNYERSRPSTKSLTSLNRLIAHEMARFHIPLTRVYTHRELRSTACPGRYLQTQMVQIRRPGGQLAMQLHEWTNA